MKRLIAFLVLAMMVLTGCAGTGLLAKPWENFTPKEKAIYFMDVYNGSVETYKADLAQWKLMPPGEGRNVVGDTLKARYAVFAEVHPLLLTYKRYAENGEVPMESIEQNIIRLIGKMGVSR